ncbi:uncharacterized protein LOC142235759 [Haematobia irritans]|uniref:uncharacterized protein LOC142235759 n=1 Tax=Haematobia irritans TaxID=7368 RepID=UPI003F4FC7BE
MGCASSNPMVQNAGSEMLKTATHVAEDATKTAEVAVQGVKDSMGKTLESAKETVTAKVEEVKHDVETTLKEKVQDLDEVKNNLLGKLNLNSHVSTGKVLETAENSVMAMQEDVIKAGEEEVEQVVDTLHTSTDTMLSKSNAMAPTLARTDTETDSLRTTTPEPEIERALANTKSNNGNDDDEDNPPTPKPTLAELENLSHELLQKPTVNDTTTANDQVVANLKMPQPSNTTDTTNSSAMQLQLSMSVVMCVTHFFVPVQNPILESSHFDDAIEDKSRKQGVAKKILNKLVIVNSNIMISLAPLQLTSATSIATAIAASTAGAGLASLMSATPPPAVNEQESIAPPVKSKAAKRLEKLAAEKVRQQKLIQKLLEEKRPRTTEWEKYADMLALFRKYNPHDAFRRGGTLTKFNGQYGGAAPIRENPLHGFADDNSSDTTSVWGRKSPTRRSSARLNGRMQRQTQRPTSASQRTVYGQTARRGSNAIGSGRKFDYNPSRSRVNERGGSSSVSSGQNLYQFAQSKANAYHLSPSSGTQSPTYAHERVKSPLEMRSQHHPLGANSFQRALEPIWYEQSQVLPLGGQQSTAESHLNAAHTQPPLAPAGSSMPLAAMSLPRVLYSPLTRESSATSLSSQTMYPGHIRSSKSSQDLRMPPVHQYHYHQCHHNHDRPMQHPPVRNTSSFLATPRTSPFGITKSYTDLYFSSTSSKENEIVFHSDLSSISQHRQHIRDKSPYKMRDRCEHCVQKYMKT